MGVEDFLPEGAPAGRGLRILAPLLDLIGLVELGELEGLFRGQPVLGQGECDDQRAGGAGGGGEAGQGEGRAAPGAGG